MVLEQLSYRDSTPTEKRKYEASIIEKLMKQNTCNFEYLLCVAHNFESKLIVYVYFVPRFLLSISLNFHFRLSRESRSRVKIAFDQLTTTLLYPFFPDNFEAVESVTNDATLYDK